MKIGIQLWTVRDVLKKDFVGTLERLAKMQMFQGLEFAFFHGGLPPSQLADLMKRFQWETSGLFGPIESFTNPKSKIYSYACALQCRYLIGSFGEKDLDSDLNHCLSTLQKACSVAAAKGITICYHGHPFDYADKPDGHCYMDALLEVREVKLVPDTGWINHAGKDVVGFLKQNAERIPIIHLKDTKANKTITELGNGVIDLPMVIDFAMAHNVEWLDYEQDDFAMPCLEGCQRSCDHLRNICRKGIIDEAAFKMI
ncbi:MAG: sugar phosphate isomerase/epimerase [Verrucomicrobiae bacterium]|nr:sugar phosphate isomerase/epimerase [Verrucomicrobiae bacterium]